MYNMLSACQALTRGTSRDTMQREHDTVTNEPTTLHTPRRSLPTESRLLNSTRQWCQLQPNSTTCEMSQESNDAGRRQCGTWCFGSEARRNSPRRNFLPLQMMQVPSSSEGQTWNGSFFIFCDIRNGCGAARRRTLLMLSASRARCKHLGEGWNYNGPNFSEIARTPTPGVPVLAATWTMSI